MKTITRAYLSSLIASSILVVVTGIVIAFGAGVMILGGITDWADLFVLFLGIGITLPIFIIPALIFCAALSWFGIALASRFQICWPLYPIALLSCVLIAILASAVVTGGKIFCSDGLSVLGIYIAACAPISILAAISVHIPMRKLAQQPSPLDSVEPRMPPLERVTSSVGRRKHK